MTDVKMFDSGQAQIELTTAAIDHFIAVMAKDGTKAVRFAVKPSGCSGYSYVTETVESGEANDLCLTLEQRLTVYIDPESLALISGMTVDYVKENLGQSRLVYRNPREEAVCGCGESFSIAGDQA